MHSSSTRTAGILGSALALAILGACDKNPATSTPAATTPATNALSDDRAKYSYAIGMRLGEALLEQGLDVDHTAFVLALTDTLSHAEPRLTEDARTAAIEQHQDQMRQEMQREADQNLAKSKEFLEHNRTEQGIVQTDSGLQYKVLQAGTGAKPAAGDNVTVHYTGTLIDGTEFDSSRRRGEPVTFATTNVIPGWQEALNLMHAGDHWQVFVPPDLAYGERGAGGSIGPNQTLIFDIELLKVEAANTED